MKKSALLALVVSLGLAASACSSGSGETGDTQASSETESTDAASSETSEPAETTDETEAAMEETTDPGTSDALVTTAESELGEILVDESGLTLYGFTTDTEGTPTCEGGCADTWPALTVEGDELPARLDPAVFSLVDGVDGKKQLKAGDWPLYYYASDAIAGDTNGQGVNDLWYVVSPTGELIQN